jgi:hypothetical protein
VYSKVYDQESRGEFFLTFLNCFGEVWIHSVIFLSPLWTALLWYGFSFRLHWRAMELEEVLGETVDFACHLWDFGSSGCSELHGFTIDSIGSHLNAELVLGLLQMFYISPYLHSIPSIVHFCRCKVCQGWLNLTQARSWSLFAADSVEHFVGLYYKVPKGESMLLPLYF